MKREYPESPIVGVGGIIFANTSVLLVKRNKEPGKGLWSLPGGAVELGETLTDALEREIAEEASIEIEIGGLVRVLDRIVHDPAKRVKYHYVIVDYWGSLVSGQPEPATDVSDARFVKMSRLNKWGINRVVEETILMADKMRIAQAGGSLSNQV
ncbi:MAG: NUDIX hydrolase [Deltaproteobacteria bacterium]|nr:NUDIX hydrolase [Deltaproteobacteria bacterium]